MRYCDIFENKQSNIEPTAANIAQAKDFVFRKWVERATERGEPSPHDLTHSCKFSSMFAQKVFGGILRGNYDHQYVMRNGQIIDLNSDAEDVRALAEKAYIHDPVFWMSADHRASMSSCKKRVDAWVAEFFEERNDA